MDETYFKIRTYGKKQLAKLYYPDVPAKTAYYRLRRSINQVPRLRRTIMGSGKPRMWYYTPKEVRLIVDALGVPESYFID